MIAFLRGRVLDKHPNRIVIDVNGIGYELYVPLSTYYHVGEAGMEIALHVHTHVREDAIQLYGFLTTLEQQLFERLIAISGIGPKLAIAVLSGIDTDELVSSIQRADVARLTRIPGIGKKTAERIVLELKDRLADVVPSATTGDAGRAQIDHVRDDLVSALQNLGYHRPLAEKAVDAVRARDGSAAFEDALKGALRELMR
ncbi:MAG TPA: Holliday junction branch migration protein RuvA [Vicinamibacterales bacterium]|nr:Holliday junction branch migration protein RuvA [Vicinamibacterales bacterium]